VSRPAVAKDRERTHHGFAAVGRVGSFLQDLVGPRVKRNRRGGDTVARIRALEGVLGGMVFTLTIPCLHA